MSNIGASGSRSKYAYPTAIPSALQSFADITSASQGKNILMFLDYDGTLSPIVNDPYKAFMSDDMRETVGRLNNIIPTAIVSGRERNKVYEFVQLDNLCYAGSHGMDIKYYQRGKDVFFQPEDAQKYPSMIAKVYEVLFERTKHIPGTVLETNTFCMSVHYRNVNEQKLNELRGLVEEVLATYPNLRLSHGKKVFEVRPTIKWDKGDAVKFLLKSLGFGNSKHVYPIYIGDDVTDEDAFRVLKEGGQGIGILVSKEPRDTSASFRLKEPSEVKDFMNLLIAWKLGGAKEKGSY